MTKTNNEKKIKENKNKPHNQNKINKNKNRHKKSLKEFRKDCRTKRRDNSKVKELCSSLTILNLCEEELDDDK